MTYDARRLSVIGLLTLPEVHRPDVSDDAGNESGGVTDEAEFVSVRIGDSELPSAVGRVEE